MKVLVCGGRDFNDKEWLWSCLDELNLSSKEDDVIIHGNARGADTFANEWALYRNIQTEVYPALWNLHGRKAGPIRNQQMLDEGKPNLVVAAPGGSGTRDMINRARKHGIRIWEMGEKEEEEYDFYLGDGVSVKSKDPYEYITIEIK